MSVGFMGKFDFFSADLHKLERMEILTITNYCVANVNRDKLYSTYVFKYVWRVHHFQTLQPGPALNCGQDCRAGL